MRTLISFLLMLLPATALPADACKDDAHRQFDFWVGSWRVENPAGKVVGTNRISKIAGGCALLEEWSGVSGMTGKSLNTFDGSRGLWHQTWVDSNGSLLVLEGKFENGVMRLQSANDRISWSMLPEGRVRQIWEQSSDKGKSWKVIFDGRYIPDHRSGIR